MKLDKYKNLLFEKIKNQIKDWFETENLTSIPSSEVYRFLHSLKGTSGTLQLTGLFQITEELIQKVLEVNKEWSNKELKEFLYELMELSYEYEHFNTHCNQKSEVVRDKDVPLIQIIDDDVTMLILLKDALEEKGWMVVANTEPNKAIEQYFDLHPDFLIIDVNLPNKNGFETLETIQEHCNRKFIPTIMISILNDRQTRINAFKKGADDFIAKPIDLEELIVRVERHLERKKIFDQSVLVDELTQLYNRRFLQFVYESNINDYVRTRTPFTIAVLDLDNFKSINDYFSHITGDKVLIEFSNFLKEHVRSSDTVFRYGGEEFVILFPSTNDKESKEILEHILNEFSKLTFTEENNQQFSVTFSAGVFMVHDEQINLLAALKMADEALYTAKSEGRARVKSTNKGNMEVQKKKLFISIIDDDPIIRMMLLKIVDSIINDDIDFDIKAYEDGIKFLDSQRIENDGEHFIILDGIMPVMDGLEILKKVKHLENASNMHVLMLTGRKSEDDIARALKLGADDYVTKPFSITELEARIQRLILRITNK